MTDAWSLARTQREDPLHSAENSTARLANGVHAVVDHDWIVFLDVARNRYRAVAADAAPPIEGVCASGRAHTQHEATWRALAKAGLVRWPRTRGPVQASIETPPNSSDWWSMWLSALWSWRTVQSGRLDVALAYLSKLKRALASCPPDLTRAIDAYGRYSSLRVWIPARYVCLFDSLALMRFLLKEGIGAELVFGVRGRPFAAHCWVECQSVILDDGGEACGSFSEILRL